MAHRQRHAARGQERSTAVDLLDLERIEVDIFRGISPGVPPTGLRRTGRRPGAGRRRTDVPTDGRCTRCTRTSCAPATRPCRSSTWSTGSATAARSRPAGGRGAARQGDLQPVRVLPGAEDGLDHQRRMPDARRRRRCRTLPSGYAPFADRLGVWPGSRGRSTCATSATAVRPARRRDRRGEPHTKVWMRADGAAGRPALHVCALAFACDLTLLDSVLSAHGLAWGPGVHGASLDHAMWFHRPFRADEWLLYESESPSASGGRGLATGRIWSRDGRHVASVVQEGLVRSPRRPRATAGRVSRCSEPSGTRCEPGPSVPRGERARRSSAHTASTCRRPVAVRRSPAAARTGRGPGCGSGTPRRRR